MDLALRLVTSAIRIPKGIDRSAFHTEIPSVCFESKTRPGGPVTTRRLAILVLAAPESAHRRERQDLHAFDF